MKPNDIRRASLDEVRGMKGRGELSHDPDAPAGGEVLDAAFWAKASLVGARSSTRSVHLKIDADVFEFFKAGGKGHVTRMQDVLKAYVRAHRVA